MSIEDLKVKPEILSPKPPSIASDEEFAAGTSTTASPTVKQAKEKLVTTDTTQTITSSKNLKTGGTKGYSRPFQIFMPTSTESNPTEEKTREIAFLSSDGTGNNYEGSLTHSRFTDGTSYTGLRTGRLVNGTYTEASIGAKVAADGTTFATAPNTPDNAPANAIVTKDKISNMVTTNTAQTISGVKTFTANTIVKGSGANNGTFTIKNDVTTYGTSAVDLVVATVNGGNQFLVHFQEGSKWCAYFIQDPSTKNISFSMAGCASVYAPTPAVASNDTQVATTAWFNSKMQVVSALPAAPDANVFYFIPE